MTFIKAGEFFPPSWLFEKTPTALYFYEAATDLELFLLPREAFLNYIKKSPDILLKLVNYYASAHTSTLMQINALSQTRAREKVVYMLFYLTQRFGQFGSNETITVELQLTHQQFASLVGLTRETITIELNRLKRLKVITHTNHVYQVNLPKLSKVLGEDTFLAVEN